MITYILYLAWAIVTLGSFIYFIAICIHGVKLIRRKLGVSAAFFFVIGLLAFTSQSGKRNDDKKFASGKNYNDGFYRGQDIRSSPPGYIHLILQNNFISVYDLNITYGQDSTGVYRPTGAFSSTNGFIGGTHWNPASISVNNSGNTHNFTYQVTGTVEWKLLSITVYHQPKIYEGFAKIP